MRKEKINIGVTGTGSLIGQGIIKCIQVSSFKDNVNITGFDYVSDSVGSFWCDNNYLLPDVFKKNESEDAWVSSLIEIINKHQLRILFVGIDFELPLFAKLKSKLEEATGCFIVVNSEEVIRIANDKLLTAQFLKDNNLNYPESYTREEYEEGLFEYPLIVKPRVGARSVGFNLIKSKKEFDSVISSVDNPVIQECIGKMENEYTCGVIYLDGELKASIALSRTLREGNTFTADYRKDTPKVIYEYLKAVTEALKPFGVVNYQLRMDSNNEPKIFEINARHSGTTFMRSLFGYNEVEYIIAYLLNEQLPAIDNLKEGRAVRYFDEFFTQLK